jgi:hypothetical protein
VNAAPPDTPFGLAGCGSRRQARLAGRHGLGTGGGDQQAADAEQGGGERGRSRHGQYPGEANLANGCALDSGAVGPHGAGHDTDREFSTNFDRQASATNGALFLGLPPTKVNKTVSFFISFISFHRGRAQSGILFLVSLARATARRIYHPSVIRVHVLDLPC